MRWLHALRQGRKRAKYLERVARGTQAESEGLIERRLSVVPAHSRFLLHHPLLSPKVDNI